MPSIVYFEIPLLPGKAMFRCDKLSANLQPSVCAGMWEQANGPGHPLERLARCKQCVVGAKHAGAGDVNMSALRGSATCARCNRTDLRLIGGNVCVGCKNREYEWVNGKNARGNPPATHPVLERRCVRYSVGGEVKTLSRSTTASSTELVIELMRDQGKRVLMGRMCVGPKQRQGVLL
jgi:hypothetical protein